MKNQTVEKFPKKIFSISPISFNPQTDHVDAYFLFSLHACKLLIHYDVNCNHFFARTHKRFEKKNVITIIIAATRTEL